MAQVKNAAIKEFDTVIIGGGLSGLVCAHQLEATGRRVALIEALDVLGGNNRAYQSPAGPIDHGLKYIPATAKMRELLDWLEGRLEMPIHFSTVDEPPTTFEGGRFQPFVGFGEKAPEAIDELMSFLSPAQIVCEKTPKDWVSRLAETFTGEVFLQSHLTRFHVDDGFVVEALINGSRRVSATEFIFCAPPMALAQALPETALSARQRQKLTRGKFFTAVYLDVFHPKKISETRAIHMLSGGSDEPVVGRFISATSEKFEQVSQWCTFIRADLTDDPEETLAALKRIKKQVKRGYEEAFAPGTAERILVTPARVAKADGLLTEEFKWPRIENLWLASPDFNAGSGLLGVLDQCQRVLNGFSAIQPPVDPDEPRVQRPSLSV